MLQVCCVRTGCRTRDSRDIGICCDTIFRIGNFGQTPCLVRWLLWRIARSDAGDITADAANQAALESLSARRPEKDAGLFAAVGCWSGAGLSAVLSVETVACVRYGSRD